LYIKRGSFRKSTVSQMFWGIKEPKPLLGLWYGLYGSLIFRISMES